MSTSSSLQWKAIFIIIVIAICVWGVYPPGKKINLGLDLQGGMHLLLDVDTDVAVDNALGRIVEQIKGEFDKGEVDYTSIKNLKNIIRIELFDTDYLKDAKDILKSYTMLTLSNDTSVEKTLEYIIDKKEIENIKKGAVSQALEIIRNRIDQFGVAEPIIQRQGDKAIIVQLPGIKDRKRAIELIGKTALLEFKIVNEKVDVNEALKGNLPPDSEILYEKVIDNTTGKEISRKPFLLKKKALMTGDYISGAEVKIDSQDNQPYVFLRFDKIGARLFANVTKAHLKERLAIVLDGSVYSAPTIQDEISGGEAQITGRFSDADARDLAIVLRAGSLPAPVNIVEDRMVGPSLGMDSIQGSVKAAIIGGSVLFVFMIIYYKGAGLIANIGIFLNLIIILGVLSFFGATLTLPGIAGMILNVGMALDANVLIYERIREELKAGRPPKNAVKNGFSKAFYTIFDSNVTNLIAAIILFEFGTGPIKGFAVTLTIGIFASMFTACFAGKVIFDFMVDRDVKKLSI